VLSRRRFLLGSAAVPAALGAYAWRVEPQWLELVRRPLPIRRLPQRLNGRTLVHVSDLHVGPRVDDEYVLSTFARIRDLRPDIVVVTGDFISYHNGFIEQVSSVYRHFPRGRMATVGVFGNHDYGPQWAYPEVAQDLVDTLSPLGISILRNQIQDVDGLQIGGLDDFWARRFGGIDVIPRLDGHRAALVLSHNPDTVDLPVWDGYDGWILSGHTHGGQCRPPFLPPPVLPVRNRRYTAGEFALSGDRRLYISRGVGHLFHVRFNVRPEATAFELQSA
jgi:uncharacterized protein